MLKNLNIWDVQVTFIVQPARLLYKQFLYFRVRVSFVMRVKSSKHAAGE